MATDIYIGSVRPVVILIVGRHMDIDGPRFNGSACSQHDFICIRLVLGSGLAGQFDIRNSNFNTLSYFGCFIFRSVTFDLDLIPVFVHDAAVYQARICDIGPVVLFFNSLTFIQAHIELAGIRNAASICKFVNGAGLIIGSLLVADLIYSKLVKGNAIAAGLPAAAVIAVFHGRISPGNMPIIVVGDIRRGLEPF